MNVLAFKLSPIGDTVMFLPVLQALRRLRPDWRLTVCTTPACAVLFRPWLEPQEIVVAERSSLHRGWRRPWSLLPWLRRVHGIRPDAVLLSFDQSSVARLLATASGAGLRIAGAGAVVRWRGGLTHEVAPQPGQSIAQWEWEMARVLARESGLDWAANPPPPVIAGAKPHPRGARPRVLVHAGASRAYQLWPGERYAQLAERLSSDCDVTWIDLPGVAPQRPNAPVRIAESGDLGKFIALAADSDLFVGNHSGPFHLASAAGVPCVIPTGPTLPPCDPPWASERTLLLRRSGLACMPCDKLIVSPNRCLNTATPMACLNYWSVEAVEQACRGLLEKTGFQHGG